ncbi:MAG: hypothetical protein ACXVS6_12100 [Solirubrobacteraceae bacterium]
MVHAVLIRASTNPFVQHLPHLAFVLVGVIAYFWVGYRHRPREGGADDRRGRRESRVVASTPTAPRRVRRPVARRALLALAPLIGAVATGAVLYGLDAGRDHPGAGVIWSHVGFSILALLLVGYKLKALGVNRLRHAFTSPRLSDVLSLVLGALLVPLLITGIVLLIAPSTGSFTAYLHLVASAWWTAMLVWHLWRYMAPAVRSAGQAQPTPPPTPTPTPTPTVLPSAD